LIAEPERPALPFELMGLSSSVISVPGGYHGIDIHQIWPPSSHDIDSRWLPILDEAEVVHLHEALPASLKTLDQRQ